MILALAPWISRHRTGKGVEQIDWRGALIIGFLQCLAMWPGTSRSLVTILGGLAVGLSLPAAVEFAFLLGLLTLTAATAYKGVKIGHGIVDAYGWNAALWLYAGAALIGCALLATTWGKASPLLSESR